MNKETCSGESCCNGKRGMGGSAASGGVYGLGFLGAAFYFIQHATTFWLGVLGIVKAIFWPAVLIYKVLGFLNM